MKKLKASLSLLLVLVMALSLLCTGAFADGENDTTQKLDVSKTVSWPINGDKTKAQITITSDVPEVTDTKVLFLGTLCAAHGMDATSTTNNTIITSINAIAKNAEVTYYLLAKDTGDDDTNNSNNPNNPNNRGTQETKTTKTDSKITYSGKVSRNGTVTNIEIQDSKNHASLKGFMSVLYDELITKGNVYDYIVLEFDSSRIADGFDLSTASTLTQAKIDALANKLNDDYYGTLDETTKCYTKNKVIWITDGFDGKTSSSTKNYGVNPYTPTNVYYTQQDGTTNHLSATVFRYLCAVVAPGYYLAHTDANNTTYYGNGSTDKTLDSAYCLKLGTKAYSALYAANVYTDDSRQMYYNNASELADFLYMAIQGVTMNFSDTVHVTGDIEVTGAAVSVTQDNSTWTSVASLTTAGSTLHTDATPNYYESTDTAKTIKITKDNQVSVNIQDATAKLKQIKLVIDVEDAQGFASCIEWNATKEQWEMNPNNGPATVTAMREVGGQSTSAVAEGNDVADAPAVNEYTVTSSVTNGTQAAETTSGKGITNEEAGTTTTFEGDTVTMKYTPNPGYVLKSITLDGAKSPIPLTEDGEYVDETTGQKVTVSTDSTGKVTVSFPGIAKDRSVDVVYVQPRIIKTVTSPADKSVCAGEYIYYTITVYNDGIQAISNVTIQDVLNTDLVDFVSAQNSSYTGTLGEDNKTVTWTGVAVPAATNATTPGTTALTLKVQVKSDISEADTLSNTATGTYGGVALPTTPAENVTVSPKTYTVTYHYAAADSSKGIVLPDGATPPTDSTNYNYGAEVTSKTPTLIAGYTFDGWYTNESLTEKYTDKTKIKDNLNLYGKWTQTASISKSVDKTTATAGDELTYTITLTNTGKEKVTFTNLQDTLGANLTYKSSNPKGSCTGNVITWSDQEVAANGEYKIEVVATVSGTLSANTDVSNTMSGKVGNLELSATSKTTKASPKTIKVLYEYVGDVPADTDPPFGTTGTTLDYGNSYTAEAKSSAPGYTFSGWFTDKNCTKSYKDGTKLTAEETTLYGKWTLAASLAKSVDKTTAAAGGDLTYTITLTNDSDDSVKFKELTDTLNGNLTFKSATEGGTCTSGVITWPTLTVAANKSLTITVVATVSATLTEDTEISNSVSGKVDGRELKATSKTTEASPKTVKILYKYVGDVPANTEPPYGTTGTTLAYGNSYTAETKPSAAGYTFSGWYTNANCTESYTDGTKLTAEETTLYGKWTLAASLAKNVDKTTAAAGEDLTYTITLTNASGAAADFTDLTDELNENLTFKSATEGGSCSKKGVITWPTLTVAANSSLKITVVATASATLTEDTEIANTVTGKMDGRKLSANSDSTKVSPKTIKVLYEYVGDVPADTEPPYGTTGTTLDYGNSYTAENEPSVAGYTFSGWFTDKNCTKSYKDGTKLTAEETTLYGKWTLAASLAKSVDKTTAAAGEDLTYTITLTNASGAAADFTELTDTLNGNLTFKSATEGGTCTNGVITWPTLTVAANKSLTITVVATVSATLTEDTEISNSVSGKVDGRELKATSKATEASPKTVKILYKYVGDVPADTEPPYGTTGTTLAYGNSYTAETKPSAAGYTFNGWYTNANCTESYTDGTKLTAEETTLYGKWTLAASVAKSVDSKTATAGADLTYTITLTNNSDSKVKFTDLSDELNENLTFKSATEGGTCSKKGVITWPTLTVAANGSLKITVVATASATLTEDTEIANTVTGKMDGRKLSANSDSTKVSPKTIKVLYEYVGDVPADTDPPFGTTGTTLDYGNSYTAETKPSAPGYTFSGWYTNANCTESYTDGTKLTSDETTLYGKWESAMSLEKKATEPSAGTIRGGDEVTYTITVYNDSNEQVTGVTVQDTLLANLTYVADSATGATYTEGTKTLTWSNVSVAAGASTQLTFKVTVNDKLTEQTSIGNTATATYDGKDIKAKTENGNKATITADPKQIEVKYSYVGSVPTGAPVAADFNATIDYDSAYDAHSKPEDVKGYTFSGWYTDEACTKAYTDGTKLTADVTNLYGKWVSLINMEKEIAEPTDGAVRGGGTITYQITVNNGSTSAISGVSVTDKLPENVSYVDGSVQVNGAAPADGQFAYASGTLTWSNISVAAKSSTYLTFKVTVDATLDKQTSIENEAIGSYDGKAIEAKNEDSNKVSITADPKLIAVKYEYVGTKPDGATDAATYNESVEYNSAYNADKKPDNVTGYTFSGWYTDSACKNDYTTTNLTEDETTLYGKWIAVKDFTVSKEVSYNSAAITGTIAPGSTVTYTVKVKNNNTEAAIEHVVVTDTLPEGLTVSDISDSGEEANGKITWTDVTVAAGATKELTFNATVPGDVKVEKTYVNTVAVTDADGSGYTSDPATATFTAKPTQIPVTVTKSWSDGWENHESDTVYVQMYANGTEVYDSESLIQLTKDAQSTYVLVDPYDAQGNDVTYTFKEVKVNGSAIENDSYGKYAVVYSTTESGGNLISNNYQIDADDLSFTKKADKTAVPGETFTYTLTVTNERDYETAEDIIVTDELPEGLTLTEVGGLTADIGSVEESEGTVTWTIDDLDGGETATLTIQVLVPETAESVEYENIANITQVGGTDYTDSPVPSEKAITEVRTFAATKVWSNPETNHDAITLQLKQNGTSYGEPVQVSKSTDWSYTWTKLPLYDGERNLYAYTVEEVSVEGYNTVINYGDGDITATVTNTLKTYNVLYELLGVDQPAVSAPVESNQNYGTEYQAKPALSENYYDFDGWYTDENCTTKFVDGTPITDENTEDGALKLYGKWTRKTAEITLTGGNDGPAPEEVTYPTVGTMKQGEKLPVPADPVYSGNAYVFTGWYTDPECTEPYTESVVTGDLTLYAGWKIHVTYEFPGDLPTDLEVPEDEETYAVGTKYESVGTYEPGKRYTSHSTGREYEFEGWYTDPSMEEGTEYVENTELTENTTLYGKWLNVYNISFSFGDQEENQDLAKVKPKDTDIVEGDTFVPENLKVKGYTFGGWYLDPEFTIEYDPETMTIDDDTILYGQWIADKKPAPEKPARPPHTGDSAMPVLWLSMLAIGGLGLTAVTRRKKEN